MAFSLPDLPYAHDALASKGMSRETTFSKDDHRQFNRHGEMFDVGETFSGVDFETGLKAVEELRALVPQGAILTQLALRWILMFGAVTCAIPGAKRPSQVDENFAAGALAPLSPQQMAAVEGIYDRLIREQVHQRW